MTKTAKITDAQVEILARAMEKTASDASDLGQARTNLMLHALTALAGKGYSGQSAVTTAAELADLAEDYIRASAQKAVAKSRKALSPEVPAAVMADVLKSQGASDYVDGLIERMTAGAKARKREAAEARQGIRRGS